MFVHLRLHSEFSVVDGTTRIDEAVDAAARDAQGALALTDLNNLFGALKLYKAARGKGVKPVIGAEICLGDIAGGESTRIVLLVQNRQGYFNLCELLTRAWMQGVVRDIAVCRWAWLRELAEGLIALSGAQAGPAGASAPAP